MLAGKSFGCLQCVLHAGTVEGFPPTSSLKICVAFGAWLSESHLAKETLDSEFQTLA